MNRSFSQFKATREVRAYIRDGGGVGWGGVGCAYKQDVTVVYVECPM